MPELQLEFAEHTMGAGLPLMDLLGGPGGVLLAGVDVLVNQIPREGLGLWTGLIPVQVGIARGKFSEQKEAVAGELWPK